MSGSDDVKDELPPLTAEVTARLADMVTGAIREVCELSPGLVPSKATKKLLLKRISPKNSLNYQSLDKYWVVLLDEISQLLDRILAYPSVTQYRNALKTAAPHLVGPWQLHGQSLRTGELYIIQDRTSALLQFLTLVSSDCGISSTDQRKTFEGQFKKLFERRLRERHRIVHAHEPASLDSRTISLFGETSPFSREDIEKTVGDIMRNAFEQLRKLKPSVDASDGLDPEKVEQLHEEGAVREARQMLKLVGDSMLGTFDAF